MAKTSIIGHRGASGLALENTLAAFTKAFQLGVDAIEFDVRITRDHQFVVFHDAFLARLSKSGKRLSDLTYDELRQIPLRDGSQIPSLTEVLDLAVTYKTPVIVELKTKEQPEKLCRILDRYTTLDITVASFNHPLLVTIRTLRPKLKLFLAEARWPITVLQRAKAYRAQGIDLHYMLINPLTYILAMRWGLHIMLYAPNNRLIVTLITKLYPAVSICTNYPNRFLNTPKAPVS